MKSDGTKNKLFNARVEINKALNELPEDKLAEAINKFIPTSINQIKDYRELEKIATDIKGFGTNNLEMFTKDEIEWRTI